MFKEANTLLDVAIKGADEPTFYTLQKALVQIQRATGIGGVVDPTEMANANDGARATLTRLDASPDPDFAAVAALGWNALPTPEDRQKALAAAGRALDSPPDDGDRATLVFAARQVSARTLDGAGDPNGAARQWAILLDVAQSADDEAGLVAALLNSADRHKDALASAQLLVRVANERWPLDGNAALLSGAAGRAAASPFMAQIGQNLDALVAHNDGGNLAKAAIVARAAFAVARLALANAQIAVPGAPPAADAELERATRAQSPALAALKPLAEGDDPFWATRARLLLLDAGTLAPDARRDLLQKLVASQGGEPSIALTLANADADPKTRARAAQSLDFALESWRRLALDALDNGDKTGADFWSGEAVPLCRDRARNRRRRLPKHRVGARQNPVGNRPNDRSNGAVYATVRPQLEPRRARGGTAGAAKAPPRSGDARAKRKPSKRKSRPSGWTRTAPKVPSRWSESWTDEADAKKNAPPSEESGAPGLFGLGAARLAVTAAGRAGGAARGGLSDGSREASGERQAKDAGGNEFLHGYSLLWLWIS